MNEAKKQKWQSELLDQVFDALASDDEIRKNLIFKGARVLNILLDTHRQSLDIDSSFSEAFCCNVQDRDEQADFLKKRIHAALSSYFKQQEFVRYQLVDVEIKKEKVHPLGWSGFQVRLNVSSTMTARGLPVLELDVASPEKLSARSVADLKVGSRLVKAYTLERIAGEKLRAFLSSLSTYRKKVAKPGVTIRVKDLYDEVRIERHRKITDVEFWSAAAAEFRLACESRFIDCNGLDTFKEDWDVTKVAFQKDPTLPKDVDIEAVEETLARIIKFFEDNKFIPFSFPLPETR